MSYKWRISAKEAPAQSSTQLEKKKQQSSSAAASGHDIAQETVIDLIQREADEKVSGLLR